MKKTLWEDGLRVGIRGIDDDHFILISLINEFQTAVYEGRGAAVTGKLLENLAAYVTLHFNREERLMKHHRYPRLDEHTAKHDSFARKVLQYQFDAAQGMGDLSHDVLYYLDAWLVKHIMATDMEYVPYLKERGVK